MTRILDAAFLKNKSYSEVVSTLQKRLGMDDDAVIASYNESARCGTPKEEVPHRLTPEILNSIKSGAYVPQAGERYGAFLGLVLTQNSAYSELEARIVRKAYSESLHARRMDPKVLAVIPLLDAVTNILTDLYTDVSHSGLNAPKLDPEKNTQLLEMALSNPDSFGQYLIVELNRARAEHGLHAALYAKAETSACTIAALCQAAAMGGPSARMR